MADDGLIAGAAAPAGTRLVRSPILLDALWAASVACAVVVSSRLPLIDLDTVYLRTFDPPLRVYALFIPVVAIVVAAMSVVLKSARSAAVASGLLVPSIALGGSLAGSLFLDDVSPFTDAGVPLGLAVSAVGIAMIIRWFVYQPSPSVTHDPRPAMRTAQALVVLGALLAVSVFVSALRDDLGWSLSSVVPTLLMMLTPLVVVAAGLFRSVESNALAAAACGSQLVAVVVVRLDDEGVGLDSAFTLRTGVLGLIGLTCASAVAVIGMVGATTELAADQGSVEPTDDASWRWSPDDV